MGWLYAVDYNAGKIYQHCKFTTTIESSFSSPSSQPEGVGFDDTNILSADSNTDDIYQHSGFSATISSCFSSPAAAPAGISWDSANLLSADSGAAKIYQHSVFSDTIKDSFSSPSTAPAGLAWDGTDLYSVDGNDLIYQHSGFSNTISDSFSSPSNAAWGITVYGDHVISGDTTSDKIYMHSGFTSTIRTSFSSPSDLPKGLHWRSSITSSEEEAPYAKVMDNAGNELAFRPDTIEETDISFDKRARSQDATLKSYTVANKKRFVLGFKNISNTVKDNLKTIYDLDTYLDFYRQSSDSTRTAMVVWVEGFNLHTPTNQSFAFLDRLYQGEIVLEEI